MNEKSVAHDADPYIAVEAMVIYGGSFVAALAAAWQAADTRNRVRLHVAFSDYFDEYRQIAAERATQLRMVR